MEANPVPDIAGWAGVADPDERLRAALAALYPYYRRTAGMMENLIRDEPVSELVQKHFAAYRGYIEAARETLLRGRTSRGRGRARERAAIGHALAFATWRSLTLDEGLDDGQAVELVTRLVTCR
jgi:hypothetical protein